MLQQPVQCQRKIFDALDEAIRIIRKSDGKKDAAEKLMARFRLDAVQADAVLETKLFKLSRLEILVSPFGPTVVPSRKSR